MGCINRDRRLHIHHADNNDGVYIEAHELTHPGPAMRPSFGCSTRYALLSCFREDNNISSYLGLIKQHLRPYVKAEKGCNR